MRVISDPLAVDHAFFESLRDANAEMLDRLLLDDFLLVDVMQGAEISKPVLLAAIASGQIRFNAIVPSEQRVRFYGGTAVITGSTHMNGDVGGEPFSVHSRYTHVFVREQEDWRFASAQGTPIAPA